MKYVFNIIASPIKNSSKFSRFVTKKVREFIEYLSLLKSRFSNLLATNLELGVYHFYRRDLGSAITRFKLILLVKKQVAEAYLHLSRCYYLKRDFKSASNNISRALLINNKSEEILYQWDKINNADSIRKIPDSIITEHYQYSYYPYNSDITILNLIAARNERAIIEDLPRDKILFVGVSHLLLGKGLQGAINQYHITEIPKELETAYPWYKKDIIIEEYGLVLISEALLYYRDVSAILRKVNLMPRLNITVGSEVEPATRKISDRSKLVVLAFPILGEKDNLDKNNDIFIHSEQTIIESLVGLKIIEFKRTAEGALVIIEVAL